VIWVDARSVIANDHTNTVALGTAPIPRAKSVHNYFATRWHRFKSIDNEVRKHLPYLPRGSFNRANRGIPSTNLDSFELDLVIVKFKNAVQNRRDVYRSAGRRLSVRAQNAGCNFFHPSQFLLRGLEVSVGESITSQTLFQ